MNAVEFAALIKNDTTGRFRLRKPLYCPVCPHDPRVIASVYTDASADTDETRHALLLPANRSPQQADGRIVTHPARAVHLAPGAWVTECPKCQMPQVITAELVGTRLEIALRTDLTLGRAVWGEVSE